MIILSKLDLGGSTHFRVLASSGEKQLLRLVTLAGMGREKILIAYNGVYHVNRLTLTKIHSFSDYFPTPRTLHIAHTSTLSGLDSGLSGPHM